MLPTIEGVRMLVVRDNMVNVGVVVIVLSAFLCGCGYTRIARSHASEKEPLPDLALTEAHLVVRHHMGETTPYFLPPEDTSDHTIYFDKVGMPMGEPNPPYVELTALVRVVNSGIGTFRGSLDLTLSFPDDPGPEVSSGGFSEYGEHFFLMESDTAVFRRAWRVDELRHTTARLTIRTDDIPEARYDNNSLDVLLPNASAGP